MGKPMNVGVVGVGTISARYLETLARLPGVQVAAVADLDEQRAAGVAAQWGVAGRSVDGLLDDPDVGIVLNLTIPAAHADVDLRAIAAGKHVYGEKPLAVDTAAGLDVLHAAADAGVRVGSAPDTVLGTGVQSARRLLDDGVIGEPVGAAVQWTAPGHELWHPAPQFYYQPGGGPLFDMGPYYLTGLVTLLGPVVRVAGVSHRSAPTRTIAGGPHAGTVFPVDVDTHVSAVLEHVSGVTSTVTMSFDVWATRVPLFEVYGSTGTLAVPDPNHFDKTGDVWTRDTGEWRSIPPTAGYAGAGRGYGVADMAHAIATGRPHRASGELAFHVLEIMQAVLIAGREHTVVDVASRPPQPAPVAPGSQPDTW